MIVVAACLIGTQREAMTTKHNWSAWCQYNVRLGGVPPMPMTCYPSEAALYIKKAQGPTATNRHLIL